MLKIVRDDLGISTDQIVTTNMVAVASTIVMRLLIGWLCDRIGPRLTYTWLLVLGSVPVMLVGLSPTYEAFLLMRMAIGAIGASFVITQYHTSVMFASNCVGTANATTAGWGNMGGGVTQMVMPLVFAATLYFVGSESLAWRWAMVAPGVLLLLTGIGYYLLTQDAPEGNYAELRSAGTMDDGRQAGGAFLEACRDYRVWLLFVIYGSCFGVELLVNSKAALYFADYFDMNLQTAGLIAGLFGLMNLFARTLGGMFGDRFGRTWGLSGRVKWLFMALFGEGLALMLFSQMGTIPLLIGSMLIFSLFVQMSEGATYSVVPFINKRALGAVAGIVGAGGNAGAVAAMFLFKKEMTGLEWPTSFFIVGAIVTVCSFLSFGVRFSEAAETDARIATDIAASDKPMANPIEVWKSDKHGFDVWPDVERYAAAGTPMKEIDTPDLERMKWHGFFYRKRDTPGRYMCRVRITAGELSSQAAREVAHLAYEYGHGIVDITTRANLQVQGLEIDHLPKVVTRLQKVGLSGKQSGHDNIRNVFAHPFSGLTPDELIDTRGLCHDITKVFIDSREYADLPRKMNICLNGTDRHSAHFWTQDISFLAVRRPFNTSGGSSESDPVAFQMLIGGTQGQHPRLAWHLPVLVEPHQVVDVTRAILDLFREQGLREKRNASRFRFLIERIGVGGVLEWLDERLPFRLCPSVDEPVPATSQDELIGWFRQSNTQRWTMGLSVPLGRLTWQQLEGLAVLSEKWGDGGLRTTHEQGIAVVNIPTGFKDAAATDAAALGLSVHADAFEQNTMACTGSQFCNIAVTETKGQMFQLIDTLRRRALKLHGIRIHMSGCPSSCAQHFTADIGLKGVRVRRLIGTREGFDVYLGGGIAGRVHMGIPYELGVDADQLPTLIESVVHEYYLRHHSGQTFTGRFREGNGMTVGPTESGTAQRQRPAVADRNVNTSDGVAGNHAVAGIASVSDSPDLIRHLLDEQRSLSAVEQFSEHIAHGPEIAEPGSRYTHLMPATPPGGGQQYAFHVDLDRCSGCKACVTACHSLNGLDDSETWRDVGLLVGGTNSNPVMQHVTTACHHCLEPACQTACPVDAYEKDPVTGIVKHLDDQCFGCQYCTLACPYDVPKYHKQKGIVRKCDMCSDRLAVGEAPACVQSCPHEAISIEVVNVEKVLEDSEAVPFLPGTPEPDITYPTTTFSTRRQFPRNLLPADYYSLRPQHAHWPLIVMLVLTQLSVGAFAAGLLLEFVLDASLAASMRPVHVSSALFFGLLALSASVLHLGRPQFAYRAIIGLKHSWLSREILAFGVFAALACAYALSSLWGLEIQGVLVYGVVASGIVGVLCSVMIYAFTQRAFWSIGHAGVKFLLTSAILGAAATWLTVLILGLWETESLSQQLVGAAGMRLANALICLTAAKLLYEAAIFRHLLKRRSTALKRTARLMAGELSNATCARFACGLLGGIVMPLFVIGRTSADVVSSGSDPILPIVVAMLFVACLAGELLERFLFFAAVHLQDGEAVSLTPTDGYPVNLGMACPKGWEALTPLSAPDRATTPLLRSANGNFEPVDWDQAMTTFATRFKQIQNSHGDDAVAFLSTGQIATEEMALLGALAKFGMGMRHGDGNTRQCMATSVVAYKEAFGFDAPPYTYRDFEESDVLVFVGANPCIAHPIMWERVMRNPHQPQIVTIDPRMTETAMQSTQHLPLEVKSDLSLLYGVANLLIKRGWIDWEFIEAHTTGFDEFATFVRRFTLERVCRDTGLRGEQVTKFAESIGRGERVSFWWTMGVNQSYQGVRTAQAIINLALITGNIGRPGTGANSITGQCNAMGSRLFSNTTNLLGGHDFTSADDRSKIAGLLDIDESRIPDANSWAFNEIIEGILRGKIRGLWVVCTNPAHSWINQTQCRDILDRLDFLVVQDMYHTTETAQLADLILPAAGWGEKEGTFINSERRIGRIRKVAKAPGDALSDFRIFQLVAHYWGCAEMFANWNDPEAVFEILKQCSAGQPCDITGIDGYRMLEEQGGIQWPFSRNESSRPDDSETQTELPPPELPHENERRLFEDGRFFHADGRAKFCFEEPRPLTEPPNERFPFNLLTGRGTASQWHTETRTGKSSVLKKLYPAQPFAEVNPTDAENCGIAQNDWISVSSQRGRLRARAFLTKGIPPGHIFIPMHYDGVNRLTDAVFDPYSRQPSYKACAVAISR
eukprot:g10243.t1